MERCNWEKGTLTVYERVRIPEEKKGFRKSEFWINNLWDQEKLCKKYIYAKGEHLPLAISIKRAEWIVEKDRKKRKKNKMNLLRNFELYEVFSNNCEHAVRGLKTGKDESLQIKEELYRKVRRRVCSCVPKCFKILTYVLQSCRALIYASVELAIDNVCDFIEKRGRTCKLYEKLDAFGWKVDYINIAFEAVWGFLFCLLWWAMWELVLWNKERNGKLSKDNYEDECKIMRYDMLGFFLGLVASIFLVIGLHFVSCHKIFLLVVEFALYLLLTFCFSNMLRNWGISKVRKEHEEKNKKKKYRQISNSAPALIAILDVPSSSESAPALLTKHQYEANRGEYLQSAKNVPGLIINDSPV